MIVINGHRWETLDDEMYVNANNTPKKIIAVYGGNKLVYPIGSQYYTFGIMLGEYTPLEAEAICVQNGGHLASVHSLEENNFIRASANDAGLTGYNICLGGSDYGSEGNWYWLDGTTFDFTNWNNGEPNNGLGRGQDYMLMYTSGYWDDWYGGWGYGTMPFVCKWKEKIKASSVDERFYLYYYEVNK